MLVVKSIMTCSYTLIESIFLREISKELFGIHCPKTSFNLSIITEQMQWNMCGFCDMEVQSIFCTVYVHSTYCRRPNHFLNIFFSKTRELIELRGQLWEFGSYFINLPTDGSTILFPCSENLRYKKILEIRNKIRKISDLFCNLLSLTVFNLLFCLLPSLSPRDLS